MNFSKKILGLWLCLCFFSVSLAATETTVPLTDGPYVSWQGQVAQVTYVVEGRLFKQQVDASGQKEITVTCPELGKTLVLSPQSPISEPAEYQSIPQVFALSDLHGQYAPFCSMLQAHGVVNEQNQWTWGRGHLVILGDIFDRGPGVTESLWLVHQLSRQARLQGGRVHMILGNHEVMVLQGDLRYVHEKYLKISREVLHQELPALYDKQSELGRWLRSCPTLLKINHALFVHGGIHPLFCQKKETIHSINSFIHQYLDTPLETIKKDPLLSQFFRSQGPLWFRCLWQDYKEDKRLSKKEVRRIGAYFKVKHIVVGHTTLKQVVSFWGKRIVGIDAGFKTGIRGEALLIKGKRLFRALANGTRIPLKNSPAHNIPLED